ncbi:MAG: hypothetical protein ACKN9C_02885, partial [Fluviibacter sp.]
ALKTGNTDIAEKIMQAQAKVGFGRSAVLAEHEEELEPLEPEPEAPKPVATQSVPNGKKLR